MLLNIIMSVLIATHFTPLSNDKILVVYHDANGNGVSQIWTFTGETVTNETKFVCSTARNQIPISVKATGTGSFEMNYGKEKIRGVINGETITYIDFK